MRFKKHFFHIEKEDDNHYLIYANDYIIFVIKDDEVHFPVPRKIDEDDKIKYFSPYLRSNIEANTILESIVNFLSLLLKKDLTLAKELHGIILDYNSFKVPESEHDYSVFYLYGLLSSPSFFRLFVNDLKDQEEELYAKS